MLTVTVRKLGTLCSREVLSNSLRASRKFFREAQIFDLYALLKVMITNQVYSASLEQMTKRQESDGFLWIHNLIKTKAWRIRAWESPPHMTRLAQLLFVMLVEAERDISKSALVPDNGRYSLHPYSTLNMALEEGDIVITRCLLGHGWPLYKNYRRFFDEGQLPTDPLTIACYHGHLEIATLLLERKIDPSSADTADWTPIYAAAHNGHHGIVDLLLHNNIEEDSMHAPGSTDILNLFTLAVETKKHQLIGVLLKHRNIFFIKHQSYQSGALLLALKRNDVGMVNFLLQNDLFDEVKPRQYIEASRTEEARTTILEALRQKSH